MIHNVGSLLDHNALHVNYILEHLVYSQIRRRCFDYLYLTLLYRYSCSEPSKRFHQLVLLFGHASVTERMMLILPQHVAQMRSPICVLGRHHVHGQLTFIILVDRNVLETTMLFVNMKRLVRQMVHLVSPAVCGVFNVEPIVTRR